MPRFNKRLHPLVKRLCLAGGLFVFFRYVAVFSVSQSVALLLGFGLLYELISPWGKARKAPFTPYRVSIRPNLRAILTDFDLMENTDEAWSAIQAEVAKLPQNPNSSQDREWNVWQSGFSLSVITPELIYTNSCGSFATDLHAYASIGPVGIPLEGGDPPCPSYSPSLRLKGDPSGHYSLSIRLPSWWWEKVKDKEVLQEALALKDPKGAGHILALDDGGTVDVTLALIGSEEFEATFLHQFFWVTPGFPKRAVTNALKRQTETRARLGWKPTEPTDDGFSLEHRYFTVWYSPL